MKRLLVLSAAALASFAAAGILLLRFLPQPRTPTDYLIVGTGATLVMLVVVFVGAIAVFRKSQRS